MRFLDGHLVSLCGLGVTLGSAECTWGNHLHHHHQHCTYWNCMVKSMKNDAMMCIHCRGRDDERTCALGSNHGWCAAPSWAAGLSVHSPFPNWGVQACKRLFGRRSSTNDSCCGGPPTDPIWGGSNRNPSRLEICGGPLSRPCC